jgi:uncharacterized protein
MERLLQPDRILGRTGVQVPLIGYGTAPLGRDVVTVDEAVRCLNHAIDLGVTYLDTSPDYGSEPKVGEVMKTRRGEVFLATKVNRRSKEGVLREIQESLDKLKTDHIDLIQVHAVNAWADLEQTFAPDGAIHALTEARDQGLVRFIGITGHARPEILSHALTLFPFDALLIALGAADRLVSSPETFCLPRARELNVGVIAMKVLGHGQFKEIDLALRYSLGLPGVSMAIIGLDNVNQITEIATLASRFKPLQEQEEAALIEAVRPIVERDAQESQKGPSPLFWLHDTGVTGWNHHDEPCFVRY